MYEIRHYLDAQGRDVFLEWLKALRDPIAKNQITKRTNRLEAGNFGDHKFCRDGIWELRVEVGAGYRVYYAQSGDAMLLLLCGGDKSKQDTDITRAVSYWQDWQQRADE
jgi:putative addiction module killer protein